MTSRPDASGPAKQLKSHWLAGRLEKWIIQETLKPGEVFPSIRHLAEKFGTSKQTTQEAVAELVRRGALEKADGSTHSRLRLPRPHAAKQPEDPLLPERRPNLRQLILGALLSGKYGNGSIPLPSLKTLALRLDSTLYAVRRALENLRAEGHLERTGRAYRMRHINAPSTGAGYYLVTHQSNLRGPNPQTAYLLSTLEECMRCTGFGQLRYLFGDRPKEVKLPALRKVAGFIYLPTHATADWDRYLARLSEVPMILLDQAESVQEMPFRKREYLAWLSPDNLQAGRLALVHLAKLGHRRIAFVSPLPLDNHWVGLRLAGMREMAGDLGIDLLIFAPGSEGQSRPGAMISPDSVGELRRLAGALWKGAEQAGEVPEALLREELSGVHHAIGAVTEAHRLRPLFARAMAESSVTAWILANDRTAALANEFLLRRNIDVPGRISLIGFDGSPLARRLGLATVNLAMADMAYACVARLMEHSGHSFRHSIRQRTEPFLNPGGSTATTATR